MLTLNSILRLLIGPAVVAALLALPLVASAEVMKLLAGVLLLMVMAQLWRILFHYLGFLSLGQHAFFGFGVFALLGLWGGTALDLWLVLMIVAALGALVAFFFALCLLRVPRGHAAVTSWVLAEACRLLFQQLIASGEISLLTLPDESLPSLLRVAVADTTLSGAVAMMLENFTPEVLGYGFVVGFAVLVLGGLWLLLRGRTGMVLTVIRQGDAVASQHGIQTRFHRLFVFTLIGCVTSLTGVVWLFHEVLVTGSLAAFANGAALLERGFSLFEWTVYSMAIVFVGGHRTLEGPLVGAMILFVMLAGLGTLDPLWHLALFGSLAVLLRVVLPDGVWGAIVRRWQITFLPTDKTYHGKH
ncbi:MAG: branched-chain amino acid ABC transporter permease [Alphaproteobacteria bacterium]|nr:branched-chain amino acid ABC transporter permease [Alphaproteobacteria bacterium]